MDRKSILLIVVCVLALLMWPVLVNKLYPPIPVPVSTNQVATATNTLPNGTNAPAQSGAMTPPGTAPSFAPHLLFSAGTPEQLLTVSNNNVRYIFTSHGGGLKEVELLQYPETVKTRFTKGADTNQLASLNNPKGPPVLAILGDAAIQGDGVFQLSPTADGGVRTEKSLTNG